ncbi:hypothetical protein [Cerasicoccus frondis]|uniref:hypothetical protein n=1 Tax=Cerasicoccus frondis TaxID=490090 RepID=UPI002852D7DC|nr:hypothetical protein [Cerasicoccus frondis]
MIHRQWLQMLLLCLAVSMTSSVHAANLFRGMTEQEVIEAMGPPESEMGRAAKRVMNYPGGSLELRSGRLYSADGFAMDYMAPDGTSQFSFITGRGWTLNGNFIDSQFRFTPEPSFGPQTPQTSGTASPSVEDNEAEPTPTPSLPPATPSEDEEPLPPMPEAQPTIQEFAMDMEDIPTDSYEDYISEDLEMFLNGEGYPDEEVEEEPSTLFMVVSYIVLFFVEFGLTIIILKLSFEMKGFPILFGQLILLSLLMSIFAITLEVILDLIGMNGWMIKVPLNLFALTGLILLMTDVKEFATAFSIALISRVATIIVVVVTFLLLASIYSAFIA